MMAIVMIKLTKTTRDNDSHADGSEESEDEFDVVTTSRPGKIDSSHS